MKKIFSLFLLFSSCSFASAQMFSPEIAIKLYGEAKDDSLRHYLDDHFKCNSLEDSIIYSLYSGKLSRVSGKIEEASVSLYNALGLIDFFSDNLLEAKILDELSIINRKNNVDINKAIEYINESIRIKKKLNDTTEIATSLIILGNIYYVIRDSLTFRDSAHIAYLDAFNFCKGCSKSTISTINFNIGTLELEKENLKSAEDHFTKALDYYANSGIGNRLKINFNLGSLFLSQNRIREFLEKFDLLKRLNQEYLDIEIKNGVPIDTAIKYNNYQKDIDNLNQHYLNYMGDSIQSKILQDSIHNAQDKEEQTSLITILKLEQQAAEAQRDLQLNKRNIAEQQLLALVVFLIVFLVFGYFIFRYQSLKRKAVVSELQKVNIQATLDVTKAKMQGEQEERKVIASVLHDQVASLLTAADMHLAAAKKQSDGSDNSAIEKADKIIKDVNEQVRNLSHQLVSPTLLKFGLVPALDSLVDKMQNDKIKFTFTNHTDAKRIESSKEIFLFRSCSELMQNALKYSAGNRANISLDQDLNEIILIVHDNGEVEDVYESGSGLGLAHIKNNVEGLAGKFKIDKTSGFKVEIILPVT